MATVFDVAKYILDRCSEMSTWKLQKLCYYSQAWHLAWTEKSIFGEDFEAWRMVRYVWNCTMRIRECFLLI